MSKIEKNIGSAVEIKHLLVSREVIINTKITIMICNNKKMALFKFTAQDDKESLIEIFEDMLNELGIKIISEFTNKNQVFAQVIPSSNHLDQSVKIFISWISKEKKIFCVEVRSNEAQLKENTYCEQIQKKLEDAMKNRFIEESNIVENKDSE